MSVQGRQRALQDRTPDQSRAERKAYWVSEYRTACLQRRAGVTKRDVAESIVYEAKRTEGRGFRVSVRSLELWSRDATTPIQVPRFSAKALGRRVRGLRKELGWTQPQLSRATGITQATLANYECGVRVPTRDNLVRLSLALCEPLALLLFGKRSLMPSILRTKANSTAIARAMRHRASLKRRSDWLSAKEAASMAGQSVRTWTLIASKVAAKSLARKVRRRKGGGRPRWFIHRSVVEDRMQSNREDRTANGSETVQTGQ